MPYFMLIGAVVAKFASGAETMFARLARPLERSVGVGRGRIVLGKC
jgi:hypothetical protein